MQVWGNAKGFWGHHQKLGERQGTDWPSSEAFQRSLASCSIVPGISGPQVLWCSILATTRQEPAVFNERPTDVSYLPVPGTLQRAGVGNPPCIPADMRGESGKMKAQSWREAQLERWRLTHSILMGSYTCRRYVPEFYFCVCVPWARCPEATNSCLKSIVYSGCSAKDCTAQFDWAWTGLLVCR